MIVSIEGVLKECGLLTAVVETGGIGYELHIPLTTAETLPPVGQRVRLHTLAVYREDAQTLYAFGTRRERDFFRMLVEKVSGIGPKTALSIMSRLSVESLERAIAQSDVALLAKCPGIGKKTAERLVVELRDKIAAAPSPALESAQAPAAVQSAFADAVAALVALGFKPADADKAVRKAQSQLGADADSEALIRKAFGGL